MGHFTFVGNFQVPYSSENHHKRSLEKLGHTVKPLQEGEVNLKQIYDEAVNSDALIWVHTHSWVTDTSQMPFETFFANLRHIGIPTLTYHLDLWLGLERQKDLEQDPFYTHIEHFFTVDKLMADWFNENTNVKGHFLHAGVVSDECYIAPGEYKWDVAFVGSRGYHPEWPYRAQLIDWLKETYGDRFVHVGGDGKIPTTRGAELNSFYSTAKVIVGDTLCIGFSYPHYFSDRIFETTGRGGFIIHPYITGIEDIFEIEDEIVTYEYGDFNGLKSLIDYYIEDDRAREYIRYLGHERTKHDHTYVNRWQKILEVINED